MKKRIPTEVFLHINPTGGSFGGDPCCFPSIRSWKLFPLFPTAPLSSGFDCSLRHLCVVNNPPGLRFLLMACYRACGFLSGTVLRLKRFRCFEAFQVPLALLSFFPSLTSIVAALFHNGGLPQNLRHYGPLGRLRLFGSSARRWGPRPVDFHQGSSELGLQDAEVLLPGAVARLTKNGHENIFCFKKMFSPEKPQPSWLFLG